MRHHITAGAWARSFRFPLATLALAWTLSGTVRAEDPGQAVAAGRAAEMSRISGALTAFRGEGSDRREIQLRRESLLRWSDPIRKFSDASIWAWGEPGRPLALFALEFYPEPARGEGASIWACEFISLTAEPLEVHGANGPTESIHWKPEKTDAVFRPFPDAPPPARSPTGRLAQMKDLLKRVTCSAHPGRDVILRVMSHPLVRYTDAGTEIVDGAIFAFADGTNPEVLVLLEAQGDSPEKTTWQYTVAPITVAPFEVKIDRRDVWIKPYHSTLQNKPSAPYFTKHLPRNTPPTP